MTDKVGFEDALARLVSVEAMQARHDPARMSNMIERLGAALGLTVAVASKGKGSTIDALIEGVTSYAHEEAVRNVSVLAAAGVLK